MTKEDLFKLKVSYQRNSFTPIESEMTIMEVLENIKNKSYHYQILKLRYLIRENLLDAYSIHKKTLPAVTFCGTFNENRRKSLLKNYNSVFVIDIDKLSEQEMCDHKQALLNDEYVVAYWESPSQKGIKGLVRGEYDFDLKNLSVDHCHKSGFQKLSQHFKQNYNIELDESGSDITRLCFVSDDISLTVKDSFKSFSISESDLIPIIKKSHAPYQELTFKSLKDVYYNPNRKNNPLHRLIIATINRYLSKRKLSITGNYDSWFKVSYAIANTFTYDLGEKYFLQLCALDGEKCDITASKNILKYSYENNNSQIGFGKIITLANKLGYKTKSQRNEVSKAAT